MQNDPIDYWYAGFLSAILLLVLVGSDGVLHDGGNPTTAEAVWASVFTVACYGLLWLGRRR